MSAYDPNSPIGHEVDPTTVDMGQQKLCLARDVIVWPVRERGETVYRLEIPALHRFYRVGYKEYVFISLLDGQTTTMHACGLAAARLGRAAPTAAEAKSIQNWLLRNELAHDVDDMPPIRKGRGASVAGTSNLLQSFNPFWMKLPLVRSHGSIDRWTNRLRAFFSVPAIAAGFVLLIAALVTLAICWQDFTASSPPIYSVGTWGWLLATWVALKVVHELAHAVACCRHGGQVSEMGLVFVLFAPLAYVDVSSCWRMNSRWRRIAVAAAGMYVELLTAAVAVLVWATTESQQTALMMHNVVLAAGFSTLLFNANALMRFDGYYILADAIDIPNLYSEGTRATQRITRRVLLGEAASTTSLVGWRRAFVLAYGLAALAWRLVVCLTLFIAAPALFHGAGIVIAAMGVCLWFGRPLRQWFRFAADLQRRSPAQFVRGGVTGAVILGGAALVIGWLPIPTAVHVAAIVEYPADALVRSTASGFVRKIHVHDAQSVHKGDLLVELENRDLDHRLSELDCSIAQSEIRLRRSVDQHDAATQSILRENLHALREQRSSVAVQRSGLQLYAPRHGSVVARNLDAFEGQWISEGDPLCVISESREKEVVAVVSQHEIKQVRLALNDQVMLRTANAACFQGRLERVQPRATDALPSDSLAAPNGGSLAVVQIRASDNRHGDGQFRTLSPHFRAKIDLDPDVASQIPAGMRLEAAFGYRCETIATRLKQRFLELWYASRVHRTSFNNG